MKYAKLTVILFLILVLAGCSTKNAGRSPEEECEPNAGLGCCGTSVCRMDSCGEAQEPVLDCGDDAFCDAGRCMPLHGRTLGEGCWNRAVAVMPAPEDGFYLAGNSDCDVAAQVDFKLFRLDAEARPAKEWVFGGGGIDEISSIHPTHDGGFIAGGTTSSYSGNPDFWLMRLDENSAIKLQKTYGGADTEKTSELLEVSDWGYALAGETGTYGAGGTSVRLMRLNRSGNEVWLANLQSDLNREISFATQTVEGGYLLAGSEYAYDATEASLWCARLLPDGNLEWQIGLADIYRGSTYFISADSEGGWLIAASFITGGEYAAPSFSLMKLDTEGSIFWETPFDFESCDPAFFFQCADGGYLAGGGTAEMTAGSHNIWIARLGESGELIWSYESTGSGDDLAADAIELADGSFVIAASSETLGPEGDPVYFLLRLSADGKPLWPNPAKSSDAVASE